MITFSRPAPTSIGSPAAAITEITAASAAIVLCMNPSVAPLDASAEGLFTASRAQGEAEHVAIATFCISFTNFSGGRKPVTRGLSSTLPIGSTKATVGKPWIPKRS